MSNLQVLGRRCPIMGKALAVQSARSGSAALAGAFGGVRAYHSRVNRAKLHTSTPKEAQTIEIDNLRAKQGTIHISIFHDGIVPRLPRDGKLNCMVS
jgi:5-aminolevulinate synthase